MVTRLLAYLLLSILDHILWATYVHIFPAWKPIHPMFCFMSIISVCAWVLLNNFFCQDGLRKSTIFETNKSNCTLYVAHTVKTLYDDPRLVTLNNQVSCIIYHFICVHYQVGQTLTISTTVKNRIKYIHCRPFLLHCLLTTDFQFFWWLHLLSIFKYIPVYHMIYTKWGRVIINVGGISDITRFTLH